MAESSQKTIVVAVIGMIGTIGAALISNWEKLTGGSSTPPAAEKSAVRPAEAEKQSTQPRAPEVINVAGMWRDTSLPGNGSRITQNGARIELNGWGTTLQGVPFRSSGSGTIDGRTVTTTYSITYQGGLSSRGGCSGKVSPDGNSMTSTCTDSLLGTFVTSGVRD